MEDKLQIIEKPHALRALTILLREEGINRVAFYRIIGGSISTATNRVNELIDEGLIEEKGSTKWHNRVDLYLTEKGRKVADVALHLRMALDGEDVHCTSTDYIGSSEDSGDSLEDKT